MRASITRTALLLLPFQIVLRGGEAIFPIVLAYLFRQTASTDVFYLALSIFQLVGSILFGMFHDSALVPILAAVRKDTPDSLSRLLGSVLAHTLVWGTLLALAIGLSVGLLGPGLWSLDEPGKHLLRGMVPGFSLFLLFTSLRTLFTAVLHSDHDFFLPPIASALGMVANLTCVFSLQGSLGIACVPYALLAAEVTASILLFARMRQRGVRFHLNLEQPEPLRRFVKLMVSGVVGGAVTRVNPVIDQWMARNAGVVGGGSSLKNASDVASVPASLVQASLLSVLLIHLSEDFAHRRFDELRRKVHRACLAVIGILLAASLLLFIVREPLLRLIFLHGRMQLEDVEKITNVFPYFLVGVAPFGALLVFARAHVALENNRILFGMGVLNATSNVVLNFALLPSMGIRGLALSTSFVQTIVAVVFFILFEKRIRSLSREDRSP